MSRIGQAPIPIPSGVTVSVVGDLVTINGPKGELQRSIPEGISVAQEDGQIVLTRANDERDVRSLHDLVRSLLANMVRGVTEGFSKNLEIQGVGYRANLKGSDLEVAVGYSHPVVVKAPKGITFEVPQPTRIVVSGIDNELVGQTAAEIRAIRKPEPYKGKGIRYEGEYVRRKAGKAAKAVG